MAKKTVFMTGGTGNMGWAAVQEMIKHPTEINLKLLARRSPKNEIKLKSLMAKPNVQIVWGDLTDYDSILEGVTGSDYVLHVGGMVSPAADWKPYRTQKTNIGAARNICDAVLAQPNPDKIKVCYIGTVAETGGRNYPIHWGRCGDPIKVSIYDHYAVSKVVAERVFVESGIKNWVVMRQSGILYPNILKNMDPIMFHVPINGVLEWCTVEDSGRLMCNLVLEDAAGNLGADFWNHYFNIGSGKEYRLSNYEFEKLLLGTLGLAGPEKLFNPRWFITKNFHGQFYADGDKLEEFLHFRENLPVQDYFNRLADQVEFYFKIPRYLPKLAVAGAAKPFMGKLAKTKDFGTIDWIRTRNPHRVSAYYGSIEEYEAIPKSWDEFEIREFNKDSSDAENYKLDHGYDETKPESELDIEDMKQAAKFRGGECLSDTMVKGDLSTKLLWKCGYCGAEFKASPNLILLGGHWCPECYVPQKAWDYDNIARTNPFFAQVWYPSHRKDECNVYPFDELFTIGGIKWDDIKR